ncbi:hypothetical protein E5G77_21295 [Salmonella enterica subsp. enterica serovar Infantis]|nr:hypothetical protein [Salmonella enterica subsp. enterica serovar Infantis]
MIKIIGVSFFPAPGKHLIRTSSLPPYGVARQKFSQTISNLTLTGLTGKNVKGSHFPAATFSLNLNEFFYHFSLS